MADRPLRTLALILALACTVGCVRGCKSRSTAIHPNPNMDYQERVDPQSESEFFYDGSSMRMPVANTIARGELPRVDEYTTGLDASGAFVPANARVVDVPLLERGAERYEIFCTPCHAASGNGQGMLTARGGVPVPSFTEERILTVADGSIFDTISNGKGLMPSYGASIPVDDRWAIVAYVRQLQGKDPGGMTLVATAASEAPTPATEAAAEASEATGGAPAETEAPAEDTEGTP